MKTLINTLYFLITFFFLSISNSHGNVVILNGLTHLHQTNNGNETLTGKIKLRNDSDKPEKVLIYKEELILKCGVDADFSNQIVNPRSLSSFLNTNLNEKVLSPNEEYDVSYTILLPSDTPKGSYWTVLMIEGADPFVTNDNSGLKINSKVRYAIQIIADNGSYEPVTLSFENVKIKNLASDKKIIDVLLKNDGVFSTKTKVLLEIYNEKKEKLKVIESHYKRVYPQKCNNFEIEVSGLLKGKYDGILVADNGVDLFASNVEIEIE